MSQQPLCPCFNYFLLKLWGKTNIVCHDKAKLLLMKARHSSVTRPQHMNGSRYL